LDKLFKDIKNNGYKRQKDINSSRPTYKGTSKREGTNAGEVEVLISRSGQIIFCDGRHRLTIAKILKINKIPVIINVFHEKYIRKEIKKNINTLEPQDIIEHIFD